MYKKKSIPTLTLTRYCKLLLTLNTRDSRLNVDPRSTIVVYTVSILYLLSRFSQHFVIERCNT